MKIEQLNLKDIPEIEKIHNGVFPIPNVNNRLYMIQKVVKLDNKIVAAVFLHLTSEVTMILDENLPRVTKAKVISELFKDLQSDIIRAGLEDTHIFVVHKDGEAFARFMQEHFRFKKASGIPLYFQVED